MSTGRDYGFEAQQAAEKHLQLLGAAQEAEDEAGLEVGVNAVVWPESAGPWCGCEACVVREVLYAAWPLLLEAARAEVAAEQTTRT